MWIMQEGDECLDVLRRLFEGEQQRVGRPYTVAQASIRYSLYIALNRRRRRPEISATMRACVRGLRKTLWRPPWDVGAGRRRRGSRPPLKIFTASSQSKIAPPNHIFACCKDTARDFFSPYCAYATTPFFLSSWTLVLKHSRAYELSINHNFPGKN